MSVLCWALAACVGPQDDPSKVHDLRVLGVRLEPPEVMLPVCPFGGLDPAKLPLPLAIQLMEKASTPISFTALVVDPAGEGRGIGWDLYACAATGDRTCGTAEERVALAQHQLLEPGGLLQRNNELRPSPVPIGSQRVDALGSDAGSADPSSLLLLKVIERDTYKGLGGIRVPLVLHLQAGEEEIWAQKLMVYSCPVFPEMKQNLIPELPGLLLNGEPWAEDEEKELSGEGPFRLEPMDFADRQEAYVVPSLQLERVELTEAWKLSWHTDLGRIAPDSTGGVDFTGEESRHRAEWSPPRDGTSGHFRLWVVVRDGRGGTSWLSRRGHYTP